MRRLLAIVFVSLVSGCATSRGIENTNSVLLDYDDFGPQVIAHEIIGMKWWQWENHGDPRPTDYDIKVVVYKSMDIFELSRKYPVDESKRLDYRYLKYEDAVPYLEGKVEENVVPSVTERLRKTLEIILNAFNKSR